MGSTTNTSILRFTLAFVLYLGLALASAILGPAEVIANVPGTITQLSAGSAANEQNSPAISGTHVVWAKVTSDPPNPPNFDIYLFDVGSLSGMFLTNTPLEQELSPDIDGDKIVWNHTSQTIPGDIALFNTSTNTSSIVAHSISLNLFFQEPAIRGQYIAFTRVDQTGNDIDLYDIATPISYPVTNDAAFQSRPRLNGDVVVYEDYNSGNADIMGYTIPTGPSFAIATGSNDQFMPDIDGNIVVYVESVGNFDQIFAYDLVSGTTTQLTTAFSHKVRPRISGNRVVWADDRNGNLDLYLYDLETHTEDSLVTGPGDQFQADIGGDRIVYTDNATGFEQVYLFTIQQNDSTAPVITPNVIGTLGNNGWYVSDVEVSWSVVDDESPLTDQSGCDVQTISTDTDGISFTCMATSDGGTNSQSVTIKRDATSPTLAPIVSPNPVPLNGTANAMPNASDDLSDIASQSCDAVDTSSVGSHSVGCMATDNAGNIGTANANYQVVSNTFNFAGFFQPVDNLPTINIATAGSSIPVKFSLGGNQGLAIFAAGYPASSAIQCDMTEPGDTIEETVNAGGSSLSYDAVSDQYSYVWKTEKSWKGSCRMLVVALTDSSQHLAKFRFK